MQQVPTARPPLLRAAIAVAAIEALALAGYAVAVAVAVVRSGPGEGAGAPVEIALFLVFAAGIALIARGLMSRRHIARGPYIVTQMFGLVVGGTLVAGDGTLLHLAGWLVLLTALSGIALMLNPRMRELLDR